MSLVKGKFLKVLPQNYSEHYKLSVSKVKTFQSCRAKFYFSYIKYVPKKEWDFQHFGSFLHEVLERFEEFIKNGDKSEDNEIMKKAFNNAWKAVPFKNGDKFVKWSEKISKEQKQECLEILNYFLSLRKQLKERGELSETLETEKKFNILLQENVLINGFIDLLQRDNDGILHVIDYKTSNHTKYLKKDKFQLQTYAYALFLENPEINTIRGSYVMLRHNFEKITFEFKREDIMKCENEFIKYYNEIQEEKLYRPEPGPLCKFCDAIDLCEEGQKRVAEDMEREEKRKDYSIQNIVVGEREW